MDKMPFIVLEGIDRCGKNLQAALLACRLRQAGLEVDEYSTPDYNASTGEVIASYLHGLIYLARNGNGAEKSAQSVHDAMALQCLCTVNRYEVAAKIERSLAAGRAVVCVRWWQSAVLYGAEDGLRVTFLEDACQMLPRPDHNVLLDLEPSCIADRFDKNNRYENDITRQVRLAEAYRRMWGGKSERDGTWVRVPADRPSADVSGVLWQSLTRLDPRLRPGEGRATKEGR